MPSSARSEMVTAIIKQMHVREEDDDMSSEAVEAFWHVARWIPRSISPFMDLICAMYTALPSLDEPIEELDIEYFNRIMKMHPNFPELISAFNKTQMHTIVSLLFLFKDEVENATIKLRAINERNWPSFLYPEGTVYNESELDKDLFRGHVFLRVLRTIFTGKSSAFTGYRSASKLSQAEMHGMREVFPEAVAYAAVQCYYGLSSLDGWDTEGRFFKLDVFFEKCVGLFTEDPEDEWVIETLRFLSSNMPALTQRAKRPLADNSGDEEASGDDEVIGILAQRAARWQAAREAAQREAHQSPMHGGDPNNDNEDPHLQHHLTTPPRRSLPISGPATSPRSPTPALTNGRCVIRIQQQNQNSTSPERLQSPRSASNIERTRSGNQNQFPQTSDSNLGSSSSNSQGHHRDSPLLPTHSTTYNTEPNILAPRKNTTKKTTK